MNSTEATITTPGETFTMEVTLNRETRTVTFTVGLQGDKAISGCDFACRKGNGAKVHRTHGVAWLRGGNWVLNMNSGYALNDGACALVAFVDQVGTGAQSKHHSTRF